MPSSGLHLCEHKCKRLHTHSIYSPAHTRHTHKVEVCPTVIIFNVIINSKDASYEPVTCCQQGQREMPALVRVETNALWVTSCQTLMANTSSLRGD